MTQLRTLTAAQQLIGKGLAPVDLTLAASTFRPVSFGSVSAARTALGAPSNANYVLWNSAWTHLEQAFAAMGENDILVLPEREEPYWIDSSNGFMAAGVKEVDGTGSNGLKDGSRVPVVSNPRLWFEMCRARRGILGLGPGAVIEPTNSGWTRPRQPVLQNEPTGQQFMNRYMLDGSVGTMVGVQEKLIGCETPNAFFANFTMHGRSFGGVAYNGLAVTHNSLKTVKRVHFDGAWRGHEGVPNGEAGGLALNRGTYLIENCDFDAKGVAPSPIMWNRTQGGSVRDVRSTRPNYGMFTYWRCGGTNTWERVWMDCNRTGMNLEENEDSFVLNWSKGKMLLESTSNKFHFGMNPSGGSITLNLDDIEFSPNGWTANAVCLNVYSTSGVQRRSDITITNSLPPSFLPSAYWIA